MVVASALKGGGVVLGYWAGSWCVGVDRTAAVEEEVLKEVVVS